MMTTIELIAEVTKFVAALVGAGFVIYGLVFQLKEQSKQKKDETYVPKPDGFVYMLCALIIAIGCSIAANGLAKMAKTDGRPQKELYSEPSDTQ